MTTFTLAAVCASVSLWFALNQNWPAAILAGITALAVFVVGDLTNETEATK